MNTTISLPLNEIKDNKRFQLFKRAFNFFNITDETNTDDLFLRINIPNQKTNIEIPLKQLQYKRFDLFERSFGLLMKELKDQNLGNPEVI